MKNWFERKKKKKRQKNIYIHNKRGNHYSDAFVLLSGQLDSPLPCSWLIDGRGWMNVCYGPPVFQSIGTQEFRIGTTRISSLSAKNTTGQPAIFGESAL
jgi:hypothetical protein